MGDICFWIKPLDAILNDEPRIMPFNDKVGIQSYCKILITNFWNVFDVNPYWNRYWLDWGQFKLDTAIFAKTIKRNSSKRNFQHYCVWVLQENWLDLDIIRRETYWLCLSFHTERCLVWMCPLGMLRVTRGDDRQEEYYQWHLEQKKHDKNSKWLESMNRNSISSTDLFSKEFCINICDVRWNSESLKVTNFCHIFSWVLVLLHGIVIVPEKLNIGVTLSGHIFWAYLKTAICK